MRTCLPRPWLAVALVCLLTGTAAGQGKVVFSRAGDLFELDLTSGTTTSRGRIPATGPEGLMPVGPRWMEATRDGKLVVIDLGDRSLWLNQGELSPRTCAGRARPSPGGHCLLCTEAGGTRIVSATRTLDRPLPHDIIEPNFLGDLAAELAGITPEGLVAFPLMEPAKRRYLARPGARSHLLIAPDGSRGVAVFGEALEARIHAFALDGTGVPRRLGGPGAPLAWSWDSQWVLLQEGLPPEDEDGDGGGAELEPDLARWLPAAPARRRSKPVPRPRGPRPLPTRACAVRAMGGEAKCWNGYDALAFSPDSLLVLLRKERSLYVGRIAGVRAEPPRKIVEDSDGAAAWLP